MMEKEGEGWSEPQPLPDSINALDLHWTMSVAANDNLYFSARKDKNTDIFVSRYIDGEYTDPIHLDSPVEYRRTEIHPQHRF